MDSYSNEAGSAKVYVIDDDVHMRMALTDVLRAHDIDCASFDSCEVFLSEVSPRSPGCLVLDIRLPDRNGLDFQQQLAELGYKLPVIMITGFGDIAMTVRAMKAGAVDFLAKPFDETDFVRAARAGLSRDRETRASDLKRELVFEHARKLTTRERQVMDAVVRGLMNKQIAYELSLAEITVKLHRAKIMTKLQVRTLPELVRTAEVLASVH